MANIQMEEFLAEYPSVDLPDIQNRITFKKEFIELASSSSEQFPKNALYKSQKLFLRYMTAYDHLLNVAETGTGKTCSVVAVAEYYEEHREHIKHVYVLQKPSTIQDFKNQILCKCAGTKYQTDIVKNAKLDSTRKSNVTREIGKWYTILSYQNFATEIKNRAYTDAEIVEKFSGNIFIVDEAHNLRGSGSSESAANLSETYDIIHRVFQLVKRCKIMVSTATPMINEVQEFPRIANLALPPDRQMPLDWDYTKVTMEQMEVFLRGHVFYVRSLDTGAVPVYQNTNITYQHVIDIPDRNYFTPPENLKHLENQLKNKQVPTQILPPMVEQKFPSQTRVYPTRMGDIQEAAYLGILGLSGEETIEQEEDLNDNEPLKGERFHLRKRQASSFVFPDGSFGGKFARKEGRTDSGLGRFINSNAINEYKISDEILLWLQDLNYMSRLSGKFAEIVRIEKTEAGCGFCYTDYVHGSGAIMLGMCFQAQGFEKFDERSSVFVSSGFEPRGVCPSADTSRRVKDTFPKKLRYALLTSETPDTVIDAMLELFNSPENINGDYIKAIIGSPVARDGINIFNVRRGHLVTPGWHPSGMHQALSRFMRADSHNAILEAMAQHYNMIDPRMEVNIYIHVAISSKVEKPIDVVLITHSERKNIQIHRIMRMLKQIDIGCAINYNRNVRPSDVDYSETCDYDVCRFLCATCNVIPTDEQIDYSSYDAKYANEVIKVICREIINLVRNLGTITIRKLKEMWVDTNTYREKFIYMAIEYLLSDKEMLKDRYGLGCYLHTDGYNIYTQREFPTETIVGGQELSTYGEQLIAVQNTVFEKIVNSRQQGNQDEIISRIKNMVSIYTSEELIEYSSLIEELVISFRVSLLESAIIDYLNGIVTPYVMATLTRFSSYRYFNYEPVDDLIKASNILSSGKKSVGKQKMASGGKTRPDYGFIGPKEFNAQGKPVEIVYFHTLYSANVDTNEYASSSNYRNAHGKIRVYKKSFNTGFRDADDSENLVYSEMAQVEIRKIMQQFSSFKYYGVMDRTSKTFRIAEGSRYQNTAPYDPNEETKNIRGSKSKGQTCFFWKIPYLLDIIVHERITPNQGPPIGPQIHGIDRNALIEFIKTKSPIIYGNNPGMLVSLETEQLVLLHQWYASGADNTKNLCEIIKSHFERTGKMHVI